MLSVWILDVRDVRRPLFQDNDFHGGCLDNSSSSSGVLWAVQVTNGSHQHRTQFLPLPTGQGEGEKRPVSEVKGVKERMWEEEMEIADEDDQDTVEIALLFDLASKSTLGRKFYRHSVTTIDMRSFRAQPEKKVELWKSLHSTTPNVEANLGKIRLAVMYTEDGGDQGYLFAMFCGLLPSINFSNARG